MPVIVKILIVIGCIALFVISYLLNHRTKLPDNIDVELPDKCLHCTSTICGAKKTPMDEVDLQKIAKNCKEDEDESSR